jgi:hypothetical protein
MYTFITPLTEKQKFNLKALGLGVYLYVVFFLLLGVFFGFLNGGSGIEIYQSVFIFFFNLVLKYSYIYILLQFLFYIIARRILKKNSPKSVLKFIYTSLIILAVILIITTFFPLPGLDWK